MIEKKYVETAAIKRIRKQINTTVTNRGMIRIIADSGFGKTIMRNDIVGTWENSPADRYRVIQFTAFNLNGSRISLLMKMMIRSISPGETVPGSPELAYETLKIVLARAHVNKLRPVVVIDNSQDLSEKTLLELKKIHEISALGEPTLFSVVMFGKPSYKADELFLRPELGWRVRTIHFPKPSTDELLEMANVHGIKFPGGSEGELVKRKLVGITRGIPLGVSNLARTISDSIPGWDGILTNQIFGQVTQFDYIARLRSANITHDDVAKQYRSMFGGAEPSKSTVSKVLNGASDNKTGMDKANNILMAAESLLAEKSQEARKAV